MPQQGQVSGVAAVMTTLAMGLGGAVAVGDLRILSTNISVVRQGLQFSPGTTVFVSSLATLTMAASVLGAGVLGDKYGMRRMFLAGVFGVLVFGLIGAAAPNVTVFMIARAFIGVGLAFLTGLSLAIMNAVFPAERRASAIAWYLAVSIALGMVPTTVGGLLVEGVGWRSGLLVTPALAVLVLALTLRYVPETPGSERGTDVPGLLLVAVALIGLTYGVSELQSGIDLFATVPILAGLLAAATFVWWELRCDEPALDLRIFRSPRFNAAVTAGAANNFVQGGSMTMITFYLVVIRDQSTWAFALLLIPATLLAALAALAAGRAARRFGNAVVVVCGLLVLAASLLVRLSFRIDSPILVVAAVIALSSVGGAIVATPQTTVMMSSAPTHLGGVVSAVKTSVSGTFYGLGATLFSMFGILLFLVDAEVHLAGTGVGAEQAGEILGAATAGADGLDPALTERVLSAATVSMLEVADVLNVVMAAVAVLAAVAVGILFRRVEPAAPSCTPGPPVPLSGPASP